MPACLPETVQLVCFNDRLIECNVQWLVSRLNSLKEIKDTFLMVIVVTETAISSTQSHFPSIFHFSNLKICKKKNLKIVFERCFIHA